MPMDDSEKTSLAEAYGEQQKSVGDVEVDVSGKVASAVKESAEPEAPEEATDDESVESLKAKTLQYEAFIQQVLPYTKQIDEEDPEAGRTWDFQKIAEEQGFEIVEKGQTKETPVTEPEKTPSQTTTSNEAPKVDADFLTKLKEEIKEEVRAEMAPIRKEAETTKAQRIVTDIKTKYPDFESHASKIGEIVKNQNIQTFEQLELAYFAAKGMSGNEAPEKTGLAGTVQGTPKSKNEVTGSAADDIFSAILTAGEKPAQADTLKILTGKGSLSSM